MDLKENTIVTVEADFSTISDEDLFEKLDTVMEKYEIPCVDLVFNNAGMGPYGMFTEAYTI